MPAFGRLLLAVAGGIAVTSERLMRILNASVGYPCKKKWPGIVALHADVEGPMKKGFLIFAYLASNASFATEPAPYDYRISKAKFDSIFIQHPKCVPERMEWSQMECSNFKARASKRFSKEWGTHSYWDGYRVIDNPDADKRVNAELTDRQ